MSNIVLLDELTINKIAAGEVIERPASVIKEMVENSIDAGATSITVEIRNGGISYIRIVDNGKGIAEDDLEMAFERHATSKIRSADDLSTVTSMGFRGEALASIAAVANVELTSKPKEQENGYKIVVEGGNILTKEEAPCSDGTMITVQNLFFNTPVRYKFLKKDYTESGYIEDAITRIALVHPEIAIRLINTGKTVIQTTGNGDIKSVIYNIYGKEVAESVLEANYVYEDITVKGVVGKPEIARSKRSNQIFFVNKRYVKDKNLSAAATEAFKGMIPIGKFGFLILDLEMNPSKVDVNVHPAKLEVRFEEENKVFKAVYHTIKDTLLKGELVENTYKEPSIEIANTQKPEYIEESNYPKEKASSGLFGWRKNKKESKHEEIEENEEEGNIISQIFNNKQENKNMETVETFAPIETTEKPENAIKAGKPVDTFEVLEKLQELQQKLKKEVEEGKKELNDNNIQEDTEEPEKENKIEIECKTQKEEQEENDVEEPKNIENTEKVEEKEEITQEEVEKAKTEIDNMLNNTQEMPQSFKEMYLKTFGTMPPEDKEEEIPQKEENVLDQIADNNMSMFDNIETSKKPQYKFIGIAFNTYIILEIENELYILDQHAAHERIMYEKVKKNYYSQEEKDSQLLLLPDIITLTHKEMDIAKDNMKMFRKAGFELEEFGENTIKLSGVPEMCVDLDTKELFLETLDEINTVARTAKQEIEEKFLATVACKAAVKANMVLTTEEVNSLMDKLLELPNPFTCPHGRPTAIKMTKYDIERKFARK